MRTLLSFVFLTLFFSVALSYAQNSKIGDGFGGRLWYQPYNLTAGSYYAFTTCGDSNQLYGWGLNVYGQLGNGNNTSSSVPVKVSGMSDVDYFSSGYNSAVIKKDGSAWVWGSDFGSLPLKVMDNVRYIDAGYNSVTLVADDGSVYSVGNFTPSFGIGNSPGFYLNNPAKMSFINRAVRVANGLYTTVILLDDSSLMICGANPWGGLGISTVLNELRYTPVFLPSLNSIVEIEANVQTNLALDKNGDVFTWGLDSIYAVCFPQKINGLNNIVAISGCNDGSHFLALDANHNCYAWGDNRFGQCGAASDIPWFRKPVLVASDVNDIMAGETFSYIVKSDGTLWASGSSNGASIWMNLYDSARNKFTQIDPASAPFNSCKPIKTGTAIFNQSFSICDGDSVLVGQKTYKLKGVYTDTLTSSLGADSLVRTIIEIVKPVSSYYSTSICRGDTVLIGNKKYTVAGSYIDTFAGYRSCDSVLYTDIKFINSSGSSAYFVICKGDTVMINGNPITVAGNYHDTLENYLGCDSVILTSISYDTNPLKCDKSARFFIPNTFTPNGNAKNELFALTGHNIDMVHMQIFNRWGEKLFDTTAKDAAWDGNYKAVECQQGIYIYIIIVTGNDGKQHFLKGTLHLLR